MKAIRMRLSTLAVEKEEPEKFKRKEDSNT